MKNIPANPDPQITSSTSAAPRADRRGLVVGAGVAGIAAVAAQALYGSGGAVVPAATASRVVPEGQGYQLSQHVLRYYETTKA